MRRVPRLVSEAMSVAANTVEKIGIMDVDSRFRFATRYTRILSSPGAPMRSTVCFATTAISALKISPIQGNFKRTAFANSADINLMTAPMAYP